MLLSFFTASKPNLEYVKLGMHIEEKHPADGRPLIAENAAVVSDALVAVTKNTGGLREIDFCYESVDRSVLQQLASANLLLEKASFTARNVAYVVDLIEAFSVCLVLKSVYVLVLGSPEPSEKVPAFADACVRLRHRCRSVTVNKVQYV